MSHFSRFPTLGGALKGAVHLLVAAFPASLVTLLLLVVLGAVVSPFEGGGSLVAGALMGLMAAPLWFIGALLIGVLVWVLLNRLGRTDRQTALVAGAFAAGVAAPLASWLILTGGAVQPLTSSVGLILAALVLTGAFSGGLAGRTLWSMAYGRAA